MSANRHVFANEHYCRVPALRQGNRWGLLVAAAVCCIVASCCRKPVYGETEPRVDAAGKTPGSSVSDTGQTNTTPDAATLLRRLQAMDSVYLTALSLKGIETVAPPVLDPCQPPVEMEWQFTIDGNEQVLHRKATGNPEPHYVSFEEGTYIPRQKDGSFYTSILIEETVYFGPTKRVVVSRRQRFHVTVDNKVTREKIEQDIMNYKPDDPGPSLGIKKSIWSTGRGFSPYLHEIRSVEQTEDGKLALEAVGFESRASFGVWKLVVDPTNSYLVVAASYTREGRDMPTIELSGDGLIGEGECEVARSSQWTVNVGKTRIEPINRTVASLEADQSLVEFGRQRAFGEPEPWTTVIDRIHSDGHAQMIRPPKVTNGKLKATGPVRSRWTWFSLIFAVHVALGGLWIACPVLHRRIRQSKEMKSS